MKPTLPVKRLWKPALLLAALVGMILYAGGFLREKTGPGTVAVEPGRPLPEGAEILTVTRTPTAPRIELIGSTESDRRVQIGARLSAYVNEVFINAGDTVSAGQTLVTLDDREIREQLAAAEARLNQAAREFRRAQQLFNQSATTEQALTAAESAFNTARADLDRIKVTLSYTQVTSPIDGVVTERAIEAGDLANPGQVLVTVYDPTDMRLDVPVPVRLLDGFAIGQTRDARLDYPDGIYTATVMEIVGEIDPKSRTRRVKLQLDSRGDTLLPGTFGRILLDGAPRPTLHIPVEAVIRIGQLDYVDLVRDGRVLRRLIRTGMARDGLVEVLAGLEDGDRILRQPAGEA